jgi:glutamate racemase
MTRIQSSIGIFDSGIGGISVLREIRQRLPAEHIVYVADTAHMPYGMHTTDFIRQRSDFIARALIDRGARALVVACNTATAAALSQLRERLNVPVIGMEPAVKPAVEATRSGIIGVLATTGTLSSARFAALLARFGEGVRVLMEPCPGLVEQVEHGRLDDKLTRRMVHRHLEPLLAAGADTIILGCTHYPFLRTLIEEEAGSGIHIIDTGPAVARQLERRLAAESLLADEGTDGSIAFYTSGEVAPLRELLKTICPGDWPVSKLPEG